MKKFCLTILMIIPVGLNAFADDKKIEEITDTFINIRKVSESNDHYTFEVCNAEKCNSLGRAQGYTREEIRSMNGRQRQVGAVLLGIAAAPVIFYSTGAGITIGAGAFAEAGLVGGGITGLAAPVTAMGLIDSINPVNHFKMGGAKARVKNKTEEMLSKGQASIVLAQSTDAAKIKKTAQQLERVLKDLDEDLAHPLPANINEDPALGSSAFSGI